mgnify:CR=1 FL=1
MTTPNKPNIVFIVLDQLRWDCLGISDSVHPVMTPHFDQLAYEGMQCTQTYADCPLCMPQRATMLTGYTGSSHKMPFNFMEGPRTPVPDEYSLPHRLVREADYQARAVGKMHFFPERARLGFEHIALHPDDYVAWLDDHGYGGLYRGHGLGGNDVYPAVSAVPERFTHSAWIVEQSVAALSQMDPENPFFLWMVFEAPHSPFDPPEPYDRFYDDFDIPEAVIGNWVNIEDEPLALIEARLLKKGHRITPQVLKKIRQHYYAQITYIDYLLGRFLGQLKRLNMYDDTVIVLTSDHGEHLGDHHLFAKYTFLESSAHVPLIVKLPKSVDRLQTHITLPTLTADIVPTLYDLAGLTPHDDLDGISLLNLPQERTIFGETTQSAFAYDGEYKYIAYIDNGAEQLFCPEQDSDDRKNLISDTKYDHVKVKLREALLEHLRSHGSPLLDDQSEFRVNKRELDIDATLARNGAAWRGPMRHGDGYTS